MEFNTRGGKENREERAIKDAVVGKSDARSSWFFLPRKSGKGKGGEEEWREFSPGILVSLGRRGGEMKRKFGTEGEWFAKIIGFLVVAKENHHHGVSLRGDGGQQWSFFGYRETCNFGIAETSEFELFLQPRFVRSNLSYFRRFKFLTRVFRLFGFGEETREKYRHRTIDAIRFSKIFLIFVRHVEFLLSSERVIHLFP